ncbi:MAG: ferrochelatase [Thermodesulfovibrionales bacterium]|nr:ferrochelatase [Thermodesulfovibrionales bacterium]
MKDTGIILLNLGGPDSLGAVRPFLYNLFSDREIIRLGPAFMQRPLAWLISTTRAPRARAYYKLIGGKSPILDITKAQAEALRKRLQADGLDLPVFIGMRYWRPFIEDAMREINRQGIKRLVALSLYPHYSRATTGSSMTKFLSEVKKYPIEHCAVPSWFDHPLYIEALKDLLIKGLASFPEGDASDIHVLFSAHSLPQKFIDEGDPYLREILGTINSLAKKAPIKWRLGYQSKSGPVKWLEPSIEERLREMAQEGVKKLLVVPISFVSDHIETLYEIDILYKRIAADYGITLKRTDSLNTHSLFIECLNDLTLRALKEKGWA